MSGLQPRHEGGMCTKCGFDVCNVYLGGQDPRVRKEVKGGDMRVVCVYVMWQICVRVYVTMLVSSRVVSLYVC